MKTSKASDITTTVVGGLLLAALAYAIATGRAEWGWKVHGIWAAVGLILILPFRQLQTLLSDLPMLSDD